MLSSAPSVFSEYYLLSIYIEFVIPTHRDMWKFTVDDSKYKLFVVFSLFEILGFLDIHDTYGQMHTRSILWENRYIEVEKFLNDL